ncbi:MAG: amino terminal protease self-immunity [Verrucomicrobiaceae bacterium]|nr:amino terminal protease self-immunity [Verrucomicrobiaceae bacterium]
MPDAVTLAVLQDIVYTALLAALLGAGMYAFLRSMMAAPVMAQGGRVPCGMYGWPDAAVAGMLVLLLTSGIIMSAPAVHEMDWVKTVAPVSDATQLSSVASTIVMDLMLVALVAGFLRVIRDLDPAELFGLRRITLKQALIKALIWIVPALLTVWAVSVLSSMLLDGVWPDMGPQSSVQMLETTKSPLVKVALAFTALVVAPLAEEILFRGFLFGVLKRYTDTYFAGLISALLFATVHAHVGFFLPLFALGVVFVIAYEATGCLLVSILMHALFNGIEVVMMLLGGK